MLSLAGSVAKSLLTSSRTKETTYIARIASLRMTSVVSPTCGTATEMPHLLKSHANMGYPKDGTVRHVIMHPFDGHVVWVTWEQFRAEQKEWTSEAKSFEDEKQAQKFSFAL